MSLIACKGKLVGVLLTVIVFAGFSSVVFADDESKTVPAMSW
jgi:hypothetical protein